MTLNVYSNRRTYFYLHHTIATLAESLGSLSCSKVNTCLGVESPGVPLLGLL